MSSSPPEKTDEQRVAPATDESSSARAPAASRRRFRLKHLRRYAYSLDHAGCIVGLLFFLISLTPSLLPRTWWVQGLLSGVSLACGYAIGFVLGWLARLLRIPEPTRTVRRRMWWGVWGLAIIVVPFALWQGSSWQHDIRVAVHYPTDSRYLYGGVLVLTVLVAAGLLGVVRLVHDLDRFLLRHLLRWLPRRVAAVVAVLVTTAIVTGFVTGVLGNGLRAAADRVFGAADRGTSAGVHRPSSPLRSGGPASLASWDSLGYEGRNFVARGPSAAQITSLTHRSAHTPIRVYAGRESASTLQGEAELVLAELKRTSAFDRQVLALATSTGTGWVDPWESDSLEYLFDGDTAIASMQYSYYPSWISFLVDRKRALTAGRVLFETVHRYWQALPSSSRPKLVVFGESLGAFGANAAFTDLDNLTARTDGALFTGPPNSTPLWEALERERNPASPERHPVIGDGSSVLFAANADDLRDADGTTRRTHALYLQHASDPVVWWSADLLLSKPVWLRQSRGGDVINNMNWYPVATFWQVTCDLIAATSPPPGHGHNYGPEIILAWTSILHPPHWTATDTQRLAEQGVGPLND